MTAEQLEELLGKVTRPDKDGDWMPDVDCDGAYESIWDAKLSLMTYSLARRVIAAENMVREVRHYTYGNAPLHSLRTALTAYLEASK